MQTCRTITFGVIALNEEKYLPALLNNLSAQSYDKALIEVILVDSASSDNTKQIMIEYKRANEKLFKRIQIFDNPQKGQPSGWNVVIHNATADVILRIDAHAVLPDDYIEQCMACINTGEYVCGGPRINIIDEKAACKKMLLDAEQSMFGSGIARYRQKTKDKKYVKSLFHGAYRKEVFNKVGLFNEDLLRTEDNEMHYRIREAGYKICYDPSIQSYYQTRNSLTGMLKQKYGNGFWVGKTLFVCPKCISKFHLVPLAFVLALFIAAAMAAFGQYLLLGVIGIAYGVFAIINTVACLWKSRNICDLLLPVVFFLMHLSYGVGTLEGIISGVL